MRERSRVLLVTGTGLFLAGLVWYNYSALLPTIVAEWGLSGVEAGAVFAAFQLGYVVAILPVGALADRRSVRWVVALGCAGTGLASLGFALLADGVLLGSALRFLAGACMAGVYVPGLRFVADWYAPSARGRAVGLYVGAFSLSSGLSFFLSAAVAAATDWRTAIAATSVGAVCVAPLVVASTRDHPDRVRRTGGFDRSLLRNRRFRYAVGVYAGHNWELFGVRNWMQAFLLTTPAVVALASSSVVAGALTGAMVAVGSVANAAAGWTSDRFGRRRTLAVVLVGSAALSGVVGGLGWLPLWALAPLVVVYGVATTADSAPTSTTVTEVVPEESVGAALSLQSFVGFGVSVVSPVVFGLAVDAGGYAWAFPTAALGPLFALLCVRWLGRTDAS